MWWPPQCENCNDAMMETEKNASRTTICSVSCSAQNRRSGDLRRPACRRPTSPDDAAPLTSLALRRRKSSPRRGRRFGQLITGNLRRSDSTPIPWLYLHGDNGTYKSTLLCATCLELIRLGKRVKYLLWPEAIDELRGLNSDAATETVSSFVKRLVEVPHLGDR
jgi:hypothetical protein